jgi:putative addiction module antidote
MIALKITIIGNSAGFVLPLEVLARLKIQRGDTVYLVKTRRDLGSRLTTKSSPGNWRPLKASCERTAIF